MQVHALDQRLSVSPGGDEAGALQSHLVAVSEDGHVRHSVDGAGHVKGAGEVDERHRGEVITTSASARPSLAVTSAGADPSRRSQVAIPVDPAPVPTEVEAPAAVDAPPLTGVAAVVSGVISSLIFTVVYLPFTVAILTQSAVQRRPILPKDWQTELTGPYWLFSFSLFAFLFLFPFVLVYGLMSDSGLWSIYDNDVRAAIPFTLFLALYLSLFVALHFTTLNYAFLRPDLRVVHSRYRQFHVNPSNLLCAVAIVFEAFQLISPWLTYQSLGLHSTFDDARYKRWLSNSAQVFGIGSWQVVSVNTYLETFWTAFSIVLVYALALGYGIYSNMQPDHALSGVLFELIPGTLYLSIVARLFSILNCKPDSDGTYILQGNDHIQCWDSSFHRSMCMAAFMGLLFYSSSAMFVACYRGDASGDTKGVKFKPVYLVLERTLRDLFAMTTSLITEQTLSRSLSYPILIALVASTWYMQPCSVPSLNRLKVLSQGSAVWLLTLTFLADIFRGITTWFDSYVPEMLIWGWVTGLGLYVANEAYWWWGRSKRKQFRRASIGMMDVPFPAQPHNEDDDDEPMDLPAPLAPITSPMSGQPTESTPTMQSPAVVDGVPIRKEELESASKGSRVVPKTASSRSDSSVHSEGESRGDGVDGVVSWSSSPAGSPPSLKGALNIKALAMKHCQTASIAEQLQAGLVPGVPRQSIS